MRAAVAPCAIPGTPRPPACRAASVVTGSRAFTAAAAARGSSSLAGRASASTSSPRGGRGGPLRAFRDGRGSPSRGVNARRATVVAAALPPNKEWPPPDVWSEFRATHAGTWSGFAARFRSDGAPVHWATGEVAPAPQWRRTRASSEFAGPAKIQDVDSLTIETTYEAEDVGTAKAYESESVSSTSFTSTLLGGGQMGKMCVAQGDFASGPVLLPKCEAGASVRFELGFARRVPENLDADYGDGELEPWDVRAARGATPSERTRLFIDVVADPGAKRNWRADTIEMVVERKDGSAHERLLRDELAPEPDDAERSDAVGNVGNAGVGNSPGNSGDSGHSRHSRHSYLGEDDLASGAFRAVAGATFLTCESLLDDAAFDAFWLETLRAEREKKEGEKEKASAPGGRAARAGKRGKARGVVVVKRDGEKGTRELTNDVTQNLPDTTPEEEARMKEAAERAREDAALLALPKPEPRDLVVVPTWAVRAKAPFTSAHEYVVGGASPLVLLPRKTWVLVESVGDEVLVEAGAFAGEHGLGFSDFFDREEEEEEDAPRRRPRRAVARRYERGGRFASAFFVEETEMTKAELDDELEEGEGGKPLTF